MNLTMILGVLLLATAGGSYSYATMQKAQIRQLQVEMQTAVNNQKVLEDMIEQQNMQIEEQLENQRLTQIRIADLSEANQTAREEVTKLRNTFARHDLNSLAIAKPELIERAVNRGTKRVGEELMELTNPRQFDEKVASTDTE